MSCELDSEVSDGLCLWQQSGAPLRWVEGCGGHWNHHDWLGLLADLERSGYGALDPDAVGLVLEKTRRRWGNLRRWQESGAAWRWVEAHQGRWGHDDWLGLLRDLQRSDFWPLEPEQVGKVLEGLKTEWRNLRRWREAGEARWWAQAHRGAWNHDDWLSLLETLRFSAYWPLNPDQVGLVLEEAKEQWWNLRQWQESGAARRWVEAHRGQWGEDNWLLLVEELRQTGPWPLDVEALERLLETTAREWQNLRRWQQSGEALWWVEARQGEWDHDDWLALLGSLQWAGLWPIDPVAVGRVLEDVKAARQGLREGQIAGPVWPRLAHPGPWEQDSWLSIMEPPPPALEPPETTRRGEGMTPAPRVRAA